MRPDRVLAQVRRRRRSDVSRATVNTVIAGAAIGTGKLSSSSASWSSAAPTAQIMTAAAAPAMARRPKSAVISSPRDRGGDAPLVQ